jgi:hypothetical protein
LREFQGRLLTHSPYPRLSQTFLNAADRCDIAIFVGTSLRDHHVRDVAGVTARRVPVFIVNPAGDTFALENAKAIKQCASTFLMATLPHALMAKDPTAALASIATEASEDRGVLVAVRQALDAGASVDIRCRALEQLDDMGTTLDHFLLRKLLADRNTTVARYTLGLISLSERRLDLVEEAAATPHANDPAFSEDLELLRQMLLQQRMKEVYSA